MSVVIVGNKEHEGVWEVWEGDNWSDGYGKYRYRRGMGSIRKGPSLLSIPGKVYGRLLIKSAV